MKKNLHRPTQNEWGALFEGFIFMLLCFQRDTFQEIDDISYWSPAETKLTEVDFLVQKGPEEIAIQVKSTTCLRPEHLLGLQAISQLKGLTRKMIVYLGKEKLMKEGGIEVLPFEKFVDELKLKRI